MLCRKRFSELGWSFPVEWTRHRRRDQASRAYEESVRQSIWIILGTAKGERVMRPDFGCGIYDLVFEVNTASTAGKSGAGGKAGAAALRAAHRRARRCRCSAEATARCC